MLDNSYFVVILDNMKAELLYRFREDYSDGAILEVVVWRVPKLYQVVGTPISTDSSTVIPGNGWWVMTMNGVRVTTGIKVTRKWPTPLQHRKN